MSSVGAAVCPAGFADFELKVPHAMTTYVMHLLAHVHWRVHTNLAVISGSCCSRCQTLRVIGLPYGNSAPGCTTKVEHIALAAPQLLGILFP